MADTLDVLTLAEGQAAVVDTSAGGVTKLEAWITAVSRRIDDLCGPVVIRTITDERHFGNTDTLFLHHHPVQSVTTVTEYASGTGTVLTAETLAAAGTYLYDSRLGTLTRRSSWSTSTFGQDVLVTYVAGRYATTEDVDPLFKQAAVIMLTHLWRSAGTGRGEVFDAVEGANIFGTPTFAVPRAALELLGSEVKAPAIA